MQRVRPSISPVSMQVPLLVRRTCTGEREEIVCDGQTYLRCSRFGRSDKDRQIKRNLVGEGFVPDRVKPVGSLPKQRSCRADLHRQFPNPTDGMWIVTRLFEIAGMPGATVIPEERDGIGKRLFSNADVHRHMHDLSVGQACGGLQPPLPNRNDVVVGNNDIFEYRGSACRAALTHAVPIIENTDTGRIVPYVGDVGFSLLIEGCHGDPLGKKSAGGIVFLSTQNPAIPLSPQDRTEISLSARRSALGKRIAEKSAPEDFTEEEMLLILGAEFANIFQVREVILRDLSELSGRSPPPPIWGEKQ